MIVKTQEVKNTIKAKGRLEAIDDMGLVIVDPKTDEKEMLTYDELRVFIGKTVTLSVGESKKDEIVTTEVDYGEDNEDCDKF